MSEGTPIEWTDDSWNPIRARVKESGRIGHYCVKVSPGCRECYAEGLQIWPIFSGIRYAAQDRDKVEIFFDHEVAEQPLRRRRARKIFPCSMTDLFGDFVTDEMIANTFAYMAYARQHTFQVTTKRPERMLEVITSGRFRQDYEAACSMVADIACDILGRRGEFDPNARRSDDIRAFDHAFPLANVWLGASVEDQQRADERRPYMERIALERWLTWVSNEPALSAVNWRGWEFLRWFVCGGESGARARVSHPDWFRTSRQWCAKNRIPFFFKQHGAWRIDLEYVEEHKLRDETYIIRSNDYINDLPGHEGIGFVKVGKKRAGRILDGRTHDEYPA